MPFQNNSAAIMQKIPFIKMHGLGNDFVIIDARAYSITLNPAQIFVLADRRRSIGFDQLVLLHPSTIADIKMQIFNADGSEVGACGNASRCVARLVMEEAGADDCTLETTAGILEASRIREDTVEIDMGLAKFDWRDIPLSQPVDTLALPLETEALSQPVAVNMGNPHCVFFVDDMGAVDVAALGAPIETHPLFPERTNVEFVQVLDKKTLRMRVWERGVGITQACGTGACAAAVAAFRKGLVGRCVTVILDGGNLEIEYLKDGHVLMRGAAVRSFEGEVWV
jgi:diaminopimelate epimerase